MKQKQRALVEGFSTNVRSSGGHFTWYCLTLVCILWINLFQLQRTEAYSYSYCLRNSASSFHWLSSSIFSVRLFVCLVVPHPWHLLSSPLYDVSDHTNHIFSVRIWSWQHVSVIHCWVEPSLLLSSSLQHSHGAILFLKQFWSKTNSWLLRRCLSILPQPRS